MSGSSEAKRLARSLVLVAVALAVPIVPFLWFGPVLEARIEGWLAEGIPPGTVAAAVVGLLASDVVLPVPSSVVSTFAGKMLGFWGGTAASWCGMTLGAVAAFGLVRLFGRPLAVRLSSEDDLHRTDALAGRAGVLVLVLTRPIPIFAEAAVLLMGTTRLAWRDFLLAVGLSNLGIAAAYAVLGERVRFPIALAASITLPLLATAVARYLWRGNAGAGREREPR